LINSTNFYPEACAENSRSAAKGIYKRLGEGKNLPAISSQ